MDVGDDDLFAVFDSESSKAKQVVIPDPEDEEPAKVKKGSAGKTIKVTSNYIRLVVSLSFLHI